MTTDHTPALAAEVPAPSTLEPQAALSQKEQWNRAGREPFPFHPQASHITPDYRDGWNAALAAVAAAPPPVAPAPAQPPRQPLTEAEIEKRWHDTFSTSNPFCPCDLKSFTKAVRAVEAAHGITTRSPKP